MIVTHYIWIQVGYLLYREDRIANYLYEVSKSSAEYLIDVSMGVSVFNDWPTDVGDFGYNMSSLQYSIMFMDCL
jgi:hypothetical protein